MATRKLKPEELQHVARFAKQWEKIIVKQAFGEKGPGLDVDFAPMEEVAYAAAQGLTAGAIGAVDECARTSAALRRLEDAMLARQSRKRDRRHGSGAGSARAAHRHHEVAGDRSARSDICGSIRLE